MPIVDSAERPRRSSGWVDAIVLLGIAALFYGLIDVAREWRGPFLQTIHIELSPWALPKYTFYSLVRGFAAYVLSLGFTLVYGYIAASNRAAERIMLPILDILQSIPVLGFLPGVVLGLVAIFPRSNIGLELAAVIMIFTGQVWNMTFSFYNSLRTIPPELREAASVYKVNWWKRFTQLELPYSAIGLIWNSMMSMAGGWFFLIINEAFVLGDKDFRLPGVGSYMSVAIEKGDVFAMVCAVIAMTVMIVAVDQLFWRPIVAWAQKYKFEDIEASESSTSFVLEFLRRARLPRFLRTKIWQPGVHGMSKVWALQPLKFSPQSMALTPKVTSKVRPIIVLALQGIGIALAGIGLWNLVGLLITVQPPQWLSIVFDLLKTFIRVLVAVSVGTVFMVPIGVAIGTTPKLARALQPVVQVVASFPAPMLFPLVILALEAVHVGIGVGSVVLMMLGTQWYILFNVVAGAMGIPHDLHEAASFFRIAGWNRWKLLILPGIFPSLVTGWVTAMGGAWNASIVAEYVHFGDRQLIASGLGSTITIATDKGQFGVLAASVALMAGTVVLINRFVWRRLYRQAEERFSLSK